MKHRRLAVLAALTTVLITGCATQPSERVASNELSSKAAGYYKYRLSLQRESSFYNQYGYLHIEEKDGHDYIRLCKDLNLGMAAFEPKFQYLAAHNTSDLGDAKSYRSLVSYAKDDWDGFVQLDTLTYKDGTLNLFIITSKANRYLTRSPLLKSNAKDFDAACIITDDDKKVLNLLK